MIDQGKTWIVAADGVHLRVFEERSRSGPVRELPEHAMRIEPGDRPRAPSHPGTVHQRVGFGRHTGTRASPADVAESRFLQRAVAQLDAAANRGDFDQLVLMAPPRALGVLRANLTHRLSERLAGSIPRNWTDDDAEAMRAHLSQVRAAT